jgi:bacterial/archaeal transporter family-2 protein
MAGKFNIIFARRGAFNLHFLCLPRPLPTTNGLMAMPWWAPLGELVGAAAVIVGLMFVQKVGAGTLAGLTITANILMSLVIDKFGLFGMQQHPLSMGRVAGAALMVAGIYLISKFYARFTGSNKQAWNR